MILTKRIFNLFLGGIIILLNVSASIYGNSGNICSELGDPKDVAHIKISNRQLRKIPDCLFQFTNIRSLDIANNNITILPEKFAKFKMLGFLEAEKNNIKALPESIVELKYLVNLKRYHPIKCVSQKSCSDKFFDLF